MHLGYQFAACFLIVSRIAIGDCEQNNANGLSAFLRKIEKALSGSAFKTSDFGGCVRSVTRAIQSVDSAAQVSADPATRKVDIVTTAPREQLQSVLAAAGFAVN